MDCDAVELLHRLLLVSSWNDSVDFDATISEFSVDGAGRTSESTVFATGKNFYAYQPTLHFANCSRLKSVLFASMMPPANAKTSPRANTNNDKVKAASNGTP